MLTAEAAILIHLESVGIVFLVLLRIVVTLLAFAADESDLYSCLPRISGAFSALLCTEKRPPRVR